MLRRLTIPVDRIEKLHTDVKRATSYNDDAVALVERWFPVDRDSGDD